MAHIDLPDQVYQQLQAYAHEQALSPEACIIQLLQQATSANQTEDPDYIAPSDDLSYFESLMETQSAYVVRTDIEGRYTYVNERFYRDYKWLYGSRESVIGADSMKTIDPIDHTLTAQIVMRCFAQPNQPIPVQLRKTTPTGIPSYTLWEFTALADSNGEVQEFQCIGIDINQQVQAEHQLQQKEQTLAISLKAARAGVWIWDIVTEEVTWDETMAAHHGIRLEDFSNNYAGWAENVHPDDLATTEAHLQQALETQAPFDTQFRIVRPDGSIRWLMGQGIALYDPDTNKPLRMIGVNIDITERKRMEKLELERTRLALELDKNQQLSDERSKMISIMSHELRTPIAIVSTSSDILLRYADRLSPEDHTQRLKGMKQQIRRLEYILDQVALINKADAGFMICNPTNTHLGTFIENITSSLEDITSQEHHLQTHFTTQRNYAVMDATLMHHALSNLITNAVKYSPDGGTIHLKVMDASEGITFAVQDEGMGIPEADLKTLFAPFARGGNVGTIHGTGLGLAIVNRIVQEHNGHVQVNSQLGHGSIFSITIPKLIASEVY